MAEEAVRLRQAALGPRHADTATSLDDLGAILMSNGDAVAAEARMREALAIRRDVLGSDDPQLSTSLNNVGFVLQEKGDLPQAGAMFLESLAIDRRRLGNDHPEVAIKLVNLARLNNNQQRLEAAEPFARENFRAAEAVAREALAVFRKQPANQQVATMLMALGDSLVGQRRFAEAVPYLREANAIFDKGGALRIPWYKPEAQSFLGGALVGLPAVASAEAGAGNRAEAESLLLKGYEGLRDLPSTPAVRLQASIERLVKFYAGAGRREDAAAWQKQLLPSR